MAVEVLGKHYSGEIQGDIFKGVIKAYDRKFNVELQRNIGEIKLNGDLVFILYEGQVENTPKYEIAIKSNEVYAGKRNALEKVAKINKINLQITVSEFDEGIVIGKENNKPSVEEVVKMIRKFQHYKKMNELYEKACEIMEKYFGDRK